MSVIELNGSSTDKVDFGNPTNGDNIGAGTVIAFVRWPSSGLGSTARVSTKSYVGAHGSYHYWEKGSTFIVYEIERATTSLLIQVNYTTTSEFSLMSADAWVALAVTYDAAGADGDQKMYCGNGSTPFTEASAYNNQRVGSGAQADDSPGPWVFGNRGNGVYLQGYGAFFHVIDRYLTRGELIEQQYHPHPLAESVVFSYLGFGSSDCPNWCANSAGNGAITTGAIDATLGCPWITTPWGYSDQAPYVVSAGGGGSLLTRMMAEGLFVGAGGAL